MLTYEVQVTKRFAEGRRVMESVTCGLLNCDFVNFEKDNGLRVECSFVECRNGRKSTDRLNI